MVNLCMMRWKGVFAVKKLSKNLAKAIRDFTPFVPLTWVIFWMAGLPEYLNHNILRCVLYFVGLSVLVALLLAIGGIAAYGDIKFMDGWGDDNEISLLRQIIGLAILILVLAFFTSYLI